MDAFKKKTMGVCVCLLSTFVFWRPHLCFGWEDPMVDASTRDLSECCVCESVCVCVCVCVSLFGQDCCGYHVCEFVRECSSVDASAKDLV